ncbi:MAG: DUF3788 domain-containing protein [Lachnospiraceae bacterium]|nr:DUF3788 domain-containing protein [Lachnospiraceae bacterium]MCQ2802056.1 DUF3788 domain-containing protein [Bacilli bacterium]
MFERMLDKSINPQYSDLVGFCGTQGEMFDRFNDWVRTNFETDAEIKFPYGNSYGWCVSHHKKSKLICNVFPEKDAFCVMVRKTNKQFSEVYDKVSEQAKEVIDNKYPCNDGGWIHFRVTDEASYADIVKIMEADLFPRTHKV